VSINKEIKKEDSFNDERRSAVQDYYGRVLASKSDLKTSACCSVDAVPERQRKIASEIADEILEKSYGCGSPIPSLLDGCTVLDLGCGTGRDAYVASKLVGSDGFVVGLDMTDEQLTVARKHVEPQMARFGFDHPNVDFRQGYIEDLAAAGIEDNSVDVVISNCVINLSPEKERVFAEIFRVLRPGGELYFSDVFSNRRIPTDLQSDPILYGECLGGALYVEDFRRMLQAIGCNDHRVVDSSAIELDGAIRDRAGMIDFRSLTIRAFKLDTLEDLCEDYGQIATYGGTIEGSPHSFKLDDHHIFYTGKPMLVCGNTASMLTETRYAQHFRVVGDRHTHYGEFDCHPGSVDTDESTGGACC
jgi:arsenite methyltransferase